MVSISDEFQTHFPPIDTLFGTILKTTRLQHSKVTQSDCMFDVYAKIIGQYRKLFSSPSDCMNAQRCKNQSEPKSKLCTPFEANCSSILNVSLLFHALSLSDHKSGCVDVPQMCASVLSFDVVYNFSLDHFQKRSPCSRNVTNCVVCLQTNTIASKIEIFFDARAFRRGFGSNP